MQMKRLVAALMVAAVCLGLLAPARTALAQSNPVQIRQVTLSAEVGGALLIPGATPAVDRVVETISVSLDHNIDGRTAITSLTVTNSQGVVQSGWKTDGSGYGFQIKPPGPLPAGQTYTVRIKGGPTGLKVDDGSTLAADYVVSFRTVENPLRLTDASSSHWLSGVNLLTTDLIPRNTTDLWLMFDRNLPAESIKANMTLVDSQGRSDFWQMKVDSASSVKFQASGELPKNETYTLRIKGGTDGLRSWSGVTLKADIVLTFHTDGQAYRIARTLMPQAAREQVAQTEVYQITAAAGPFEIWLSSFVSQNEPVDVLLEDPRTPEVLLEERLSFYGRSQASLTLPRDGTYRLVVSPSLVHSIELVGQDLTVERVMPVIDLPAMEPFATQNGRFSLTPVLKNPAETEAVKLLLNDTVLREKALKADGTIDPVVIDPRTLADGVYRFRAMAKAGGSANVALNVRTFLVDRESSFTDVPATHWARRYVEVMHHLGILNGRGAGTFSPGAPVTRAEFAKMLALTLGLKPSGQTPPPFVDVADDWSAPHITALAERGLITGEVVEGRAYFRPNRTITRAEAATIVGRVLKIADKDVSGEQPDLTDYAAVPTWARPSVLILSYFGWINGFPDGSFGPAGTLNRDQAAKLLANFIGF